MKISVIGPTYPFRGGISQYTSLLVKSLRQQQDDVQFLSFSRQYPSWLYPGSSDKDPSSSMITFEEPDVVFDAINPIAWWNLSKAIWDYKADLVILPWTVAYWAPYYYIFLKSLQIYTETKSLFICHNIFEHENTWLKNKLSRKVLSLGDFFITQSHWDKANLLSLIGYPRQDQIRVSPHPIYDHLTSASVEKESARIKLKLKSARILLFFGFIREYKGLRFLLESIPLILKHFPIHLVIAGEAWGGIERYKKIVQTLNLKDKVSFHDHYIPNEDVSSYFAAADLVVVPYTSASQSGIIQLAYGFQRPVVVSKVGGLPEVVVPERTGYIVEPGSSSQIANSVIHFFSTGQESVMSKYIEAKQKHHSWSRMVETIKEISQVILTKRQFT